MNCCAARQANSSLSFVGGGGGGGGGGGTEMQGVQPWVRAERERTSTNALVRCYKEGMVISTTGEAPLILT